MGAATAPGGARFPGPCYSAGHGGGDMSNPQKLSDEAIAALLGSPPACAPAARPHVRPGPRDAAPPPLAPQTPGSPAPAQPGSRPPTGAGNLEARAARLETLRLEGELPHLDEALTHPSFANEQRGRRADNQRLEFLG